MHNNNLVHRDIKPDNILLRAANTWQLCLINFGLVYRPKFTSTDQQPRCGSEGPASVTGTLAYASLNAHRAISKISASNACAMIDYESFVTDLTFRDDLESLAYTLISLLRGSLPWTHYMEHGSIRGQLRQIQEQKKSYSGQRLASGLPSEFAMLVDYARSLPFDAVPDYAELRQKFKQCSSQSPSDEVTMIPQVPQSPKGMYVSVLRGRCRTTYSTFAASPRPLPPLKIGQLVLAQVLSATTIEGYSAQAGHERSYIHDPSLVSHQW